MIEIFNSLIKEKEWLIVVGLRKFTIRHRTVGVEDEDITIMEEPSD
jgi:hypothetical protein